MGVKADQDVEHSFSKARHHVPLEKRITQGTLNFFQLIKQRQGT